MVRLRRSVLIIVPMLIVIIAASQEKTDFSGHWRLVTSQSAGTGGARSGSSGNQGIKTSYISGAAINCGLECKIVQDENVVKIIDSVHQQGMKFPDVELSLDGHESTVAQFLNTVAKWNHDKLIVTSSMGALTATQTLYMKDGKLIVVTARNVQRDVPLTLTYEKSVGPR